MEAESLKHFLRCDWVGNKKPAQLRAMGSISTPPGGGIFRVRLPIIRQVMLGDVLQPLFFCDLSSLKP
jgi:hypothetical protein